MTILQARATGNGGSLYPQEEEGNGLMDNSPVSTTHSVDFIYYSQKCISNLINKLNFIHIPVTISLTF